MGNMRTKVFVFVLFIIVVILLLFDSDDAEDAGEIEISCHTDKSLKYGIMLDAGSQGSRIHVYRFVSCGRRVLSVKDEVFEQIKPGLSAFGKNPTEAKHSLTSLMDKALESVPSHLQSCTPLALKATAGLRMLSDQVADLILSNVKDHLESYPFVVDSVNVMEGSDEGVSAWITINFLKGYFHHNQETAMVMDLGGGSTQIVFETKDVNLLEIGQSRFSSKIVFAEKEYHLYQHSFLGYGVMEVRKKIFDYLLLQTGSNKKCSCLPKGYSTLFVQGESDSVEIFGSSGGFDECHSLIAAAIGVCREKTCSINGTYQPDLPSNLRVYAISFFYDRIRPLIGDETITLSGLEELARRICSYEYVEIPSSQGENLIKNTPMYCIDLCYMYTLWNDGYKIPLDQDIVLAKKINNFETGWALGETIRLLEKSRTHCHDLE